MTQEVVCKNENKSLKWTEGSSGGVLQRDRER